MMLGARTNEMFLRAVVIWFLVLIFAIANGFVRERFLIPQFGDQTGHVLSTLLLSTAVLISILATARWVGFSTISQALSIGLMWVMLTLAFEFGAGHYLFGAPWEKLLADYNVPNGRIWPLVLLTELVSPVLAVWFGASQQ